MSSKPKHPPAKERVCEDCKLTKPVMLEMRGLPVAWDGKGEVIEYAPGWWLCVKCWIVVGNRMDKTKDVS